MNDEGEESYRWRQRVRIKVDGPYVVEKSFYVESLEKERVLGRELRNMGSTREGGHGDGTEDRESSLTCHQQTRVPMWSDGLTLKGCSFLRRIKQRQRGRGSGYVFFLLFNLLLLRTQYIICFIYYLDINFTVCCRSGSFETFFYISLKGKSCTKFFFTD